MKTKNSSLDFAPTKSAHKAQNGINMVDLMMWLVIAALILAAAIQGIGYYQKAAYYYQVKNDVMGGATKVLSVSGMEHNGNVDQAIVDEGLVITQKTDGVVLTSGVDPNGKPLIRGTHPGIPDKEVIYLFYPYGSYKGSETIVISKDAPLGSQEVKYPASTALPNGDIDGDGIPNSTDPDIDGDGIPNASDTTPDGTGPAEDLSAAGYGDGKTAVTVGTITGDGSASFVDTTDWGHSHDPAMSNTLPSGVLDMNGWSYSQTNRSVSMKFSTNGSFTGVGGSWNVMAHADIACYDPVSKKTYYNTASLVGILHGPYTSQPGPNSTWMTITCGNSAPGTALPSQVTVRTATDAEWAGYSLGYRSYAYTLPNMVESWKHY